MLPQLSFLRRYQNTRTSRVRKRRGAQHRTRRLRHEQLEDRNLLAVVTSWADSGSGSLRDAIADANTNPGADTITFDAGLAGETITLTSGELSITDDLTITGLGADQLTIRGNDLTPIFEVWSVTVEISGLSLVHGSRAIYNNAGDLTVAGCTLANNSGPGGAAILNWEGNLTVEDSTLANNSVGDNYGGAIYNYGTLTVTNSTLANNSALREGGAIFNSGGTTTVMNSTVASNSAANGGGIRNRGTLTITNSLVAGNAAWSWGPDIYNAYGTIAAAKYNVIQDGTYSGIPDDVDGNQVGTSGGPLDPMLDPLGLQNNGGPTQTIALQPGSPAINAGSNDLAVDPDGNPLECDQRGLGFDRIVAGTVDVGAFEVQNQSPTANDDWGTTAEDVPATIDVLANDVDPDGDPLTVTEVTDPAFGSATIDPDGTITYTPDTDFNGTDTFEYTASDGNGGTDTATVTITVLSADEQIDNLLASVQQLVDDGALNKGQGNALSVKLLHVQKKLDAGQTHVALNQLKAFSNHVADLIEDGVLTPEQGQPLLDAADDLRTSITVPVNAPPSIAEIGDKIVLDEPPLQVALDGYDPDGDPLTYTVTSDNPNVIVEVLQGNRSMLVDVADFGQMNFQLFEQRAPRPTGRVIELVENDFYDGLLIHRVIEDFVIQGGDPTGTGSGGSALGYFDDQYHVDLQHSQEGTLSYAKSADDTNNSQFFVTLDAWRHLDFNHSVFGTLVEGLEVLRAIGAVETDQTTYPPTNRPLVDIVMTSVDIFTDTENAVMEISAKNATAGEQANITVTVDDGNGNSTQTTFTVTVAADTSNGSPFLEDLPDFGTAVNMPVEIPLAAIDVEGDAVYYDAMPIGSVPYTIDVNHDTGLVIVTPPPGYTGDFEVLVGVKTVGGSGSIDPWGGAWDTQVVKVTVTSNETLTDFALADDGLLDDVLPGKASLAKGGKKK